MFSHTDKIIAATDELAKTGNIDDVLKSLRELCLDDFAELLSHLPDPRFPWLSLVLPKMASEQVQKDWTGNSGIALLGQTTTFVRLVASNCQKLLGRNINDGTILDFGCGYGRIIRLMYYYSSPSRIWGLDPWEKSIALCRADGVLGHLGVSDYLPTGIPVGETRFDLIYAFSVFTHLSERAASLALNTLRRYVARDALFVMTIRPKEYWHQLDPAVAAGNLIDRDEVAARHETDGFAFVPHTREPVEGDVTYGDTSLSFEWIEKNAKGWKMIGYDWSLMDPLQIHAYLIPK
jgi:SAM-dependent methyltransferase